MAGQTNGRQPTAAATPRPQTSPWRDQASAGLTGSTRRPGGHATPPPVTRADDDQRPVVLPVVAAAACAALAGATAVWGVVSGVGGTDRVPLPSLVGAVLGVFGGVGACGWYRLVNLQRQLAPTYVEPAWRPSRLVGLVGFVAWAAGVVSVLLLSLAWSRR